MLITSVRLNMELLRKSSADEEFSIPDDLAPWRQKRHKLNDKYINNYYKPSLIPKSDPVADFDDRNALYSV